MTSPRKSAHEQRARFLDAVGWMFALGALLNLILALAVFGAGLVLGRGDPAGIAAFGWQGVAGVGACVGFWARAGTERLHARLDALTAASVVVGEPSGEPSGEEKSR